MDCLLLPQARNKWPAVVSSYVLASQEGLVHGGGQMCLTCWYRMKNYLQYVRNFVFDRAVIQEAKSMFKIHLICCYSFSESETTFCSDTAPWRWAGL